MLSCRVGTNCNSGRSVAPQLPCAGLCPDDHEKGRRQGVRFRKRSGTRGLRVTVTSPLAALRLCFFRSRWEPLTRPDESPLNGSMQARF